MKMVVPNEGKVQWLNRALMTGGGFDNPNYLVMLFKNDYVPDDDSTLSSFVESTFGGYASVFLLASDFPVPSLVGDVAESTNATPPVFECTSGSELCYGWFMLDADVNFVYAAQRFDTPRLMEEDTVLTLDPFTIKLKTFT